MTLSQRRYVCRQEELEEAVLRPVQRQAVAKRLQPLSQSILAVAVTRTGYLCGSGNRQPCLALQSKPCCTALISAPLCAPNR